MAKIDMKDVKKDNMNSAEINELKTTEQADVNETSDELINNASETAEDTNETAEETQTKAEDETKEAKSGTVVIRYIGSGIWKDSNGAIWASENKSANILNERQYDADVYEKREDIKFMVKYGAMTETYVK